VEPDRVTTRATGGSILNDVAPLAGGKYAKTEPRQLVVPDDVVLLPTSALSTTLFVILGMPVLRLGPIFSRKHHVSRRAKTEANVRIATSLQRLRISSRFSWIA
jgi:hypothetical protein